MSLSFYSYHKQKGSLGYINDLFRHYTHKEINFLTLELYQKKLNLVTQGLLGKNDNWKEKTTEVQKQLISLIKDQQDQQKNEAFALIEKQNQVLKNNKAKELIALLKQEKRLYLYRRKELNSKNEPLQAGLIEGTKGILKVLTYYSLGMSALFFVFVFLINLNKKNVQRLALERKKRDFMLDSLDCAVLLLDRSHKIISFNEKSLQVWGASKLNLGENKPSLSELIPSLKMEGDEKNLIEYRFENSPLDKSLRSSKLSSGLSLQINIPTQSLQTQWFQLDMKAFKGELFLLSFINTTHLMEAKLLIEKQQQSLIEQSKMSALGQMSGGMAHEINNPLAIISSEAEELLEIAQEDGNVAKEDATSISTNIKTTTERIAKIIRGLRVFAREDKGGEFEKTELSEVVKEVLIMAKEKFKTKGVKLEIQLNGNEKKDHYILANEVQIIQVLVNLLNNAYDAVKEQKNRRISFTWSIMPKKHIFTIKDNGPGIPQNIRSKVFDPFFTTKKVGEGTGLGLSLSRSIMLNHGGELSLGEVSDGCEFIVTLPEGNEEVQKWAS